MEIYNAIVGHVLEAVCAAIIIAVIVKFGWDIIKDILCD